MTVDRGFRLQYKLSRNHIYQRKGGIAVACHLTSHISGLKISIPDDQPERIHEQSLYEEFANRTLVALLLKIEPIVQQYFSLVQQRINQSEQDTLASDNFVEGNLSFPFLCFVLVL